MYRYFRFGFFGIFVLFIACEASLNEVFFKEKDKKFNEAFYSGFYITNHSLIPFVHPDILLLNDTYYLTITPYYNSNDKLENPCVYISNNRRLFVSETENINPLVQAPMYDHNDDPDIFFDTVSGLFIINYLETMRPDSQNVISLVSHDAILWQRKRLINYDLMHGDDFIVSPSMILYKDNYYLFFVNVNGGNMQIEYLKSHDVFVWHKNENRTAEIKMPEGFIPWHLDVIKGRDCYYLLCVAFRNKLHSEHSLLLFRSDSLENWKFEKELLNNEVLATSRCRYVYRSTGIVEDDSLSLWYSYMKNNNTWNIGYARISLEN